MSDKPLSVSALHAMRVADIKALAAQMGINLDPKARKVDYINAIKSSGAPFVTRKRRAKASAEAPVSDKSVSEEYSDKPVAAKQGKQTASEQLPLDDAEKAAALEAIGEAAQRKAQGRRTRRSDAASAVSELTHGSASAGNNEHS